ncbi:MAG: hypothetical protein HYY30_14110 [Chloroflexi bacterium]|nr:hypothetical protein [Chloroflexota bacterium]
MRKGTFEEEGDSAGGQKVYRLKWNKRQYTLTSKEILSGLFVRYLISRGKLSEFYSSGDQSAAQANE